MSAARILFLLFVSMHSVMGIKTMKEYFESDFNPNDLTTITWDHAVNNRSLLEAALKNKKQMIEADIISQSGKPVMGHNPWDKVDITFEEFLEAIIQSEKSGLVRKGIKLDFKSTDAFNAALVILEDRMRDLNFPVWINGDIIKGPQGLGNGVDLSLMNEHVSKFDNAVMSLGWTTGDYKNDTNYNEHVAEISRLLQSKYPNVLNSKVDITFPVRAMYIAKTDMMKVKELIGERNTLTVWSGIQDTDHVDVASLKSLLENMRDRIYLDVPDDLKEKLDGNTGGAGGAIMQIAGLISIIAALLLTLF